MTLCCLNHGTCNVIRFELLIGGGHKNEFIMSADVISYIININITVCRCIDSA